MPTLFRHRFIVLLWVLGCALGSATAARAQPITPRLLSDEAEVSILTIYPGEALHARFGHTAIRVADPQQELDLVYNYGTFDFDSPLFVATFVRGHLDYYLSVAPMDAVLHHYQHVARRAVVEQVLDLAADERERVFAYLRHNARPENRTYRYRFLNDNCSTRVRDVFEVVLGDSLRYEHAEAPARTYRQMLSPYMADVRLLWLGIDLLLGQPADRLVGPREAMFLPLPLMDQMALATVTVAGETRQFVRESRSLYWFDGADEIDPAPPWPTWLAWTLLGAAAVMTWREWRSPRMAAVQRRRGGVVADALLLAGVGLAGLVMAAMWGATAHDVTGPNWNLWWAWPTHLLVAAALLRWPMGGPVLRGYLALTAVTALLVTVTLAWWPQSVPAVVLPVALMLALRAGWLARTMSGPAAAEQAVMADRSRSTPPSQADGT